MQVFKVGCQDCLVWLLCLCLWWLCRCWLQGGYFVIVCWCVNLFWVILFVCLFLMDLVQKFCGCLLVMFIFVFSVWLMWFSVFFLNRFLISVMLQGMCCGLVSIGCGCLGLGVQLLCIWFIFMKLVCRVSEGWLVMLEIIIILLCMDGISSRLILFIMCVIFCVILWCRWLVCMKFIVERKCDLWNRLGQELVVCLLSRLVWLESVSFLNVVLVLVNSSRLRLLQGQLGSDILVGMRLSE